MTRYYQLMEHDGTSIGVIRHDKDEFPIHKIKDALEQHFDEEVTDIEVAFFNSTGNIEISFTRNYFDDSVDGVQTWLYF